MRPLDYVQDFMVFTGTVALIAFTGSFLPMLLLLLWKMDRSEDQDD